MQTFGVSQCYDGSDDESVEFDDGVKYWQFTVDTGAAKCLLVDKSANVGYNLHQL